MSNNEILEQYLKNLQGLAPKTAAPKEEKESKELKKYKSTSNPRVGSDTLEVIQKLYNTKPETPKSQQYEHNIMEVAHPHKVILTPSYDKLNSLIENNNERQRVMINITQKPVNGLLTQHKYAQSDLAQTLIAIATDLDNQEMTSLRVLADECLADLHKTADMWSSIKNFFEDKGEDVVDTGEGAIGGSTIGAVAGGLIAAFLGPEAILPGVKVGAMVGAGLGGVLASIFNTAPQAKNVAINAEEAATQLADVIKQFPNDLFLTSLDKALDHIEGTATSYAQVVDQMHLQTDDAQVKEHAAEICLAYQKEIQQLDRLIDIFLANANAGKYEQEESDVWSKLKTPFTAIFGDTVKDAVQAMKQLEMVNDAALDGIKATQREAGSAAADTKAKVVEEKPVGNGSAGKVPTKIPGEDELEQMQKTLSEYLK